MSAFSNWNGPDCCHGPSLPQVITLEQLLTKIGALETIIDCWDVKLQDHIDEVVSGTTSSIVDQPHKAQAAIIAIVGALRTEIQAQFPGIGAQANAYTDAKIGQHTQGGTVQSNFTYYDQRHTANESQLASDIVTERNARSAADTSFSQRLAALATAITTAKLQVETIVAAEGVTSIEVGAVLEAMDIVCDNIKAASFLDFQEWKRCALTYYRPTNTGISTSLFVKLSSEHRSGGGNRPNFNKPATIYVAFKDTAEWTAIINITPGKSTTTSTDETTGATSTTTTGTAGISVLTSGSIPAGLTFGVYSSTVSGTGEPSIWLGLFTTAGASTIGNEVFVSCINAYPAGSDEAGDPPDGTVVGLATLPVGTGGVAFTTISVGDIQDTSGHTVIRLTHPDIKIGDVTADGHKITLLTSNYVYLHNRTTADNATTNRVLVASDMA